jgi:Xaa-Pro aminopeptidase
MNGHALCECLFIFRDQKDNMGLSFRTISGFGSNGAVIHYQSSNATNKQITTKGVYLLDSGGQYLYVFIAVLLTPPISCQRRNCTITRHFTLCYFKFSLSHLYLHLQKGRSRGIIGPFRYIVYNLNITYIV